MNKTTTLITFILVCVILVSCTKQGTDKKIIQIFFSELNANNPNYDSLYNKYFVTATYNGEGRSTENIKYYIDTFLPTLKSKIVNNKIEVLSLKEALNKYPTANFFRNYYDGQDKQIYICNFSPSPLSDTGVVYILMYDHKIMSTKPSATMDGKIIQWF